MKDQFNRNYCSCKYYAPCGLCTYYDKPCREVCGNNSNTNRNNIIEFVPFYQNISKVDRSGDYV